MRVERLWLTDFRNYESADLSPAPGLTVIVGDNGEGKTNLLEAIGYLATLASFRGAPHDALVREGRDRAIVRAEIDRSPESRRSTIEAELATAGRDRVLVNRQPLRRARDRLGGRPGRRANRRAASRHQPGRSPPRRGRAVGRRSAGAYPRVAGRAALARVGAAARRACVGHRGVRRDAGAAARRHLLGA